MLDGTSVLWMVRILTWDGHRGAYGQPYHWLLIYSVYRNDIDTVGVRAGCTFTGFSRSGYGGTSISISAALTERYWDQYSP